MLTKEDCVNAKYRQEFVHKTIKYADGKSFVKCRVNGVCKTWKTRPNDFQLPVKYGFRECFYITPQNAADWNVITH